MKIVPITLKEANSFVEANHRHHSSVRGCRFAIGLESNGEIIGVAICGRPVARHLDDKYTLEVNRLCTVGTKNACSMLYGACRRIAKNMGYRKVITYILMSESGGSLVASGYALEATGVGGLSWTGERRNKNQKYPKELKKRYVAYC